MAVDSLNDRILSPGALVVRRSIFIDAPPERVWQEFQSFERMARWWGLGHRLVTYEPRAGGTIEMEVEVEGALHRFGGRIVVFEAGRELTWEDNWIGPRAWATTVLSTLRLTPAAGGTHVEFIKHGFERLGAAAAEVHGGLEGGWGMAQLNALRDAVGAAPGSVPPIDDRALVVRRSIHINSTPERIWQEFESFERFAAWWGVDTPALRARVLRWEPRIGGYFENEGGHGGYPINFRGEIVAYDPPRELTFEWNHAPPRAWPAPTYVTVRLTPSPSGTLVEILHHGWERLGAMAAGLHAGFEGGWSVVELRQLKTIAEAA